MTVILAHPFLLLFYLAAAVMGVLTSKKPLAGAAGIISLAVHAAAITAMFLLDGTMEDILLFLLFSAAVSLASSLFFAGMEDKK